MISRISAFIPYYNKKVHSYCVNFSSPSNIDINVLYNSESVIAIEKPVNISYHDDGSEEGIVSYFRKLQNEKTFPYKGRIYGVHRLDRVTSGILLFAKSKQVAGLLSTAFKDKTVTKYYVALSNKKPKQKKQGWVRGDMVPSRRKSWKLTKTQNNPAVTRFFTAGLGNCNLEGWDCGDELSKDRSDVHHIHHPRTAILFQPHTGKTHQLRVAAKSLGLPILGDPIYSDGTDHKGNRRTFLHALALHVRIRDEDIAIYNPPTSWFYSNNGINEVITELMQKHCENEKIYLLI
jgi:tRNA pseudouridine32 synthase/23S rRNA pseudouridine746 synthase